MNTSLILSYCLPVLIIYGMISPLNPVQSSVQQSKVQPCSEPITWRMGSVDTLFGIDKTKLKEIMTEAGNLWSEAVDKELWQYSDSGQVALNLIYSDQQKYSDDEKTLSDSISKMKMKYYGLKIEYQKLSNEYGVKLNTYNKALENYEGFVRQYKRDMSRWSNDAVIPREVDDHLKDLKKKIEYWQTREEIELKDLNTHIKQMQKLSADLNEYADQVNELIYHYREHVAFRKTFHQGVFISAGGQKKINIYQFNDMDHLRLVLAHEIGHALGLKHVGNPESIMYYLMEEQNTRNLKLSAEDIQAINDKCTGVVN